MGAENWGCHRTVGPFSACQDGCFHCAAISMSKLFFSALLCNFAASGDRGGVDPASETPLDGNFHLIRRSCAISSLVSIQDGGDVYPTFCSLGSPWVHSPLFDPLLGQFPFPCSLFFGGILCSFPLSPAAMRWALLHFAFSPPPFHTGSPARHSAGTEAISAEL